jgi:hypothetical protein
LGARMPLPQRPTGARVRSGGCNGRAPLRVRRGVAGFASAGRRQNPAPAQRTLELAATDRKGHVTQSIFPPGPRADLALARHARDSLLANIHREKIHTGMLLQVAPLCQTDQCRAEIRSRFSGRMDAVSFAPKGQDSKAQGNALGYTINERSQALKGRNSTRLLAPTSHALS